MGKRPCLPAAHLLHFMSQAAIIAGAPCIALSITGAAYSVHRSACHVCNITHMWHSLWDADWLMHDFDAAVLDVAAVVRAISKHAMLRAACCVELAITEPHRKFCSTSNFVAVGNEQALLRLGYFFHWLFLAPLCCTADTSVGRCVAIAFRTFCPPVHAMDLPVAASPVEAR
jgi:hypothetical protein